MKKHSLFKILSITLILILVLTCFIPGRGGEISNLPIGDLAANYIQSFYYFAETFVFILAIGAFYGVLGKCNAYENIINKITFKLKKKKQIFVYATIILIALISSLTGINLPLIIFIPFLITVILELGYNKLIAISSTILPIFIGNIGGVFSNYKDLSNQYSYSVTTFEKLVGIDKFDNLVPHIILLVIGTALLILFVKKQMLNKEKYNDIEKEDILKPTVKENFDVKTWPLIVILSLLILLILLGLIPWNSLYEIDIFNKFHTWLTGLHVKNFYFFKNLISFNFPAFGEWPVLGNYTMIIITMLFSTIFIKFIYNVKFDDLLDNMINGAKKLLPTVAVMMLAYCVLVCTFNSGFMDTIIKSASKSGSINFGLASLITLFGSIFHADIYYLVAGVFTPIISSVTDESLFAIYGLLFQSVNGLVGMIAPTSLLLIFALTYLDVPYLSWTKYIWRFILSLVIIVFAVLIIMTI